METDAVVAVEAVTDTVDLTGVLEKLEMLIQLGQLHEATMLFLCGVFITVAAILILVVMIDD